MGDPCEWSGLPSGRPTPVGIRTENQRLPHLGERQISGVTGWTEYPVVAVAIRLLVVVYVDPT